MLDSFTRAYIRTALWAEHDNSDPETGGEPFDANYSESDLARDTMLAIEQDCAKFYTENHHTLQAAIDSGAVKCGPDFDEWGRAGHDFWLTRNGHGAGFWDGDWPEPYAAALTEAAHKAGQRDLYLGDDGRIYQM